jgi:hypothetical protein
MPDPLFAGPRLLRRPGWRASGEIVPVEPVLAPANDDLPLLVTKLQEDVRSREALERMGYPRALLVYLRHKRSRKETFEGLAPDHLWPTTEFVRDCLKEQRRRIVSQYRATFLVSLLATLTAGIAFLGTLAVLAK